ncbi:hypothetical protein D3C73_1315480 [compost metagenome]
MQGRIRNDEGLGEKGNQACLIHLRTLLIKQGNGFGYNPFHSALAIHIGIQSLEGDAEHKALDKRNPVRHLSGVKLGIADLCLRLIPAHAEVRLIENRLHVRHLRRTDITAMAEIPLDRQGQSGYILLCKHSISFSGLDGQLTLKLLEL